MKTQKFNGKTAWEVFIARVAEWDAKHSALQVLSPKELRVHMLLACPATMNEALELAVERETLSQDVGETEESPVVGAVSVPGGQTGNVVG